MHSRRTTFLFILSLAPVLVKAGTLYVFPDGTGFFPTIQSAIDAAQPLDTVLLAPGTYTGAGNRRLDFGGKDLVLMGNGDREEVIIDAEYQDLGIYLHSGETSNSIVSDLTVIHGQNPEIVPGGGIYCDESSPCLERLVLRENNAINGSGLLLEHSSAHVKDVLVENNFGVTSGGGAGVHWSNAVLENVQFIGNETSGQGGALDMYQSDGAVFMNCLFQGNLADDQGGAVYLSSGSPQFIGCQFIANEGYHAGAVWSAHSSSTFEDCLFFANTAWAGPGAIFFGYSPDEGSAALSNSQVFGNSTEYGVAGVLAMYDAAPVILNTTIAANMSNDDNWSAVYCSYGADPVFENVIIAFHDGSGLGVNTPTSTPQVLCSNVFGNSGGNYSGAIADQTGINGNISENPLFCDLSEWILTLANESPCLPENNDCDVLMGALGADCTVTGLGELPAEVLRPIRCFPNPFNPQTTIHFELPTAAHVSITILDIAGRRVCHLLERTRNEGTHQITWDGRSDTGEALPSGIYLLKLEAGKLRQSEKLTLLR